MKRLLTIKEFCAAYGVGHTRAYELIDLGEIEAVKIGRSTRIVVDSADAWVCALERVTPSGRADAPGTVAPRRGRGRRPQ